MPPWTSSALSAIPQFPTKTGKMPPGHTSPPTPGNALMGADLRKTARLDFPLEGHIESLSQATMAFSQMNRSTDTLVSGVKNEAEAEENARRADLPPISRPHLQRHRELYDRELYDRDYQE